MFLRYIGMLLLAALFIQVNSMEAQQGNIVRSNGLLKRDVLVNSKNEERNFITTGASKLTKQAKSASTLTEKMQLKLWLADRKSGDEVFTLLKLDKAGKIFLSALSGITLAVRYGDEGLAKMLLAAKQVPSTKEMAMKLQVAQMREWLRKGKSADDIFELLRLNGGLEKLLTNPSLSLWVPGSMRISPRKNDTFSTYYGDEAIAKMLEAAKKNPRTSNLATELQTAHFKQWLDEGAKPYMIFKMLNMNKETWMKSPDSNIWRLYNEYYKVHKVVKVSS